MRSLCYFVPGLLCLSIFLITSAFDCEEESEVSQSNTQEEQHETYVSNESSNADFFRDNY